ncbi:hypothetical protein [Halioglobus sp. HI00S01]|uniref:hypothetical protein n=1 Tax=Halioglobus sp. HI00S01 TaxID=1822214 RepID=UPI000A8EC3E2|nr:hypothetical protein [Halioglobus sp. HI00S01]
MTREQGVAQTYLEHLQQEIRLQSALVGDTRPITQMHWGGGTPTYLDHAQITELMHMLASHFNLLDKGYREYSIEIDPRTVELNTIALRPERIACYNYAHLPERFTSQRAIDRLTLSTPE